MRRQIGVAASLIGQGVVGWIATRVLDAAVNDPLVRDAGVVVIWLAVIVVGGFVLVRAVDGGPRGQPSRTTQADASGHIGTGARLLTSGQRDDPWTSGLARPLAAQRNVVRHHYDELEKITGARPIPGRPANAETATVSETVVYRGRVVDATSDAPIVGVYVTADREQRRSTWTDESGDWTLDLPRGRVWPLLFVHPGYQPTFQTTEDGSSSLVTRLVQGVR